MKKTLLIVLALLSGISVSGQLTTHYNVVKNGYNFWIGLPENYSPKDSVKVPAILFLHGRSLCGSNLNSVLRYGTLDAFKYSKLNIPAIVIAPQNPGSAWNPKKLMNILEWIESRYQIDTNRVYVLGMSLGGYGTIDFAGTHPDKIAAALALCGGGTLKDYSGLGKVPLWIIHGKADKAVSWTESRKVVKAIAETGDTTRLRYDFMEGVSHGRLARCFYMQSSYDWLLSHSLQDSTRAVNRNYTISNEAMENVYRTAGYKKN